MNNSQNKPARTIIQLTKIRQFYLPVDAESYKVLRSAGVPLTRIHENFLPTLGLLTKDKNIKAKLVDFNSQILHPYLDTLGEKWQAKPNRKAYITGSTLKFETTHASIQAKSKLLLDQIETSLRRFFTRWGYSTVVDYSESRGKCRLHVSYKYDANKQPVIPLVEDTTSMPVIRLHLGFLRISLKLGERDIETNIAIAAGSTWTSLHTSKCLYSEVTDIRPIVNALLRIVDKEPQNFEIKREDKPE